MIRLTSVTNKQQGIGLLELMLSLAIIAILLVMATRYYLVTSHNEQVNRAFTQIGAIQGGVANWKAAKSSYSGLNVQSIIDIGAVAKQDIGSDGSTILSPWGTTVTLGPDEGDEYKYTITYNGIPLWACNNLADKAVNGSCMGSTGSGTGDFTMTSN